MSVSDDQTGKRISPPAADAERLLDVAPFGYLVTTPDGHILQANQTFATTVGHDPAALVGRQLVELLSPGGRLYHETHYAPMLRMQGSVREIALELTRSDGTRVPVLLNAVLDREGDRPRQVRIAVMPATERRRYEQELLRARRRAEQSEARERALARTLQQSFTPPVLPAVRGLDLAGRFRAAEPSVDLGGDFYDVFEVAEGDWMVLLGDVCGKGVDAAVVTSLVRHSMRAIAAVEPEPERSLARLNQVLRARDLDRFCTAVAMRMLPAGGSWRVRICCAGHPPPMLVPARGEPREVGGTGSLLGVLDTVPLEEERLVLEPGATLVLFTDGVTEARRQGRFIDVPATVRAVVRAGHSAGEIADGLVDEVVTFQEGRVRDDIAVLVLRVPAETP